MSKYAVIPAIGEKPTLATLEATKVASARRAPVFPVNPEENVAGTANFNFERVLKLLTSKHSSEDRPRHLHALTKLARRHEGSGYRFVDLPELAEIAKVVLEKAANGLNPSYYDALCGILATIDVPFRDSKRSQAVAQNKSVVCLLNVLGDALVCKDISANIQSTLVTITLKYSRANRAVKNGGEGSASSLNLLLLAQSNIPGSIVSFCTENASAVKKDFALLNLVFLLAEISRDSACAESLLDSGKVPDLVALFKIASNRDLHVAVLEIIWNLVEHHPNKSQTYLGTDAVCQSLAILFHEALTSARNVAARQFRNDLATVLLLLLNEPTAEAIACTSFLTDCARGFTHGYVSSNHPDCSKIKLGIHDEDFEFHKILLLILERAANLSACRTAISNGRVLEALFRAIAQIKEETMPITSRKWSKPQLEELGLLAIRGVGVIGNAIPDQYASFRGTTQLLGLSSWCMRDTVPNFASGLRSFPGAGNSLLSTGDFSGTVGLGGEFTDRNNGRRSQLLQTIRTFRVLLNGATDTGTKERTVTDLVDQGAIDQLLAILASGDVGNSDPFHLAIWSETLMVLSAIMRTNTRNTDLLGEAGVATALDFLQISPALFNQGLGHRDVVIGGVELVWATVAGNAINTTIFLRREGLFVLLDLADRCGAASNIQNLILGCLLDICEDSTASTQLIHWRSSREGIQDYSIAQLMVEIWMHETTRLGLQRDSYGRIINNGKNESLFPLMPESWDAQSPDGPEGSIAEVASSLRSKVYAIFTKTGFDVFPNLSSKERIVIEEARAYLALKHGEIWQEVKVALEKDNIEPTETDTELLEIAAAANATTVEKICGTQTAILEASTMDVQAQLERQFESIHARHHAEQAEFVRHQAFLNRTTNHESLRESREHQHKLLETSRTLCRDVPQDAVRHEDEVLGGATCTVFASTVKLTGILQPGADGSANDDKLKHTFRSSSLAVQNGDQTDPDSAGNTI